MSQGKKDTDREASLILLSRLIDRTMGYDIGRSGLSLVADNSLDMVNRLLDAITNEETVDVIKRDLALAWVKTVSEWSETESAIFVKEAKDYMMLVEPFNLDFRKEHHDLTTLQKRRDSLILALKEWESKLNNATNPDEVSKIVHDYIETAKEFHEIGKAEREFRINLLNRVNDIIKTLLSIMVIPRSQKLYDLFTKDLNKLGEQ